MRPRSVPISVEGYIGLPGAGKTYAMSLRGLQAMRAGRRVFSNYGLEGSQPIRGWDCANTGNTKDPGPPCECGQCFVSISRAVVLVDEINLWAPSRMWNALPLGLLHRWAQVRKYQTQIIWTAQHEARVDKVVREVTGWIWKCRPIHMVFWQAFSVKAFEPSDLRKERSRPLDSQFMWLKRRIASQYDTMRLVDVGSQFGDGLPVLGVAPVEAFEPKVLGEPEGATPAFPKRLARPGLIVREPRAPMVFDRFDEVPARRVGAGDDFFNGEGVLPNAGHGAEWWRGLGSPSGSDWLDIINDANRDGNGGDRATSEVAERGDA